MALGDFVRISFPYGMQKNDKNEWFVFNREYKPLGFNTDEKVKYEDYPIFVKYKGLTDAKLQKLACPNENTIRRNDKGEIFMIWFYSDGTNPKDNPKYWDAYFKRIKILSSLRSPDL